MNQRMRIHEVGGRYSLTFDCGGLPVDEAIIEAGHEPNGYFWEGIAQRVFAAADNLDFDSEAGMFCAAGDRPVLDELRRSMTPYLGDPERIVAVIEQAKADGFEFDD